MEYKAAGQCLNCGEPFHIGDEVYHDFGSGDFCSEECFEAYVKIHLGDFVDAGLDPDSPSFLADVKREYLRRVILA